MQYFIAILNVKRNGQKTRTTLAIGTWVENWTINKP